MNYKKISKDNVEKLIAIIDVILSTRTIFNYSKPHLDIEFQIDRISIFRDSKTNNGLPSQLAIGSLQFNFIPTLEILQKDGVIEITKSPSGFKSWKIRTNLNTLELTKKKLLKVLTKPIKYDSDFAFESVIRDIFNNNSGKNIPIVLDTTSSIPNVVSIKNENINGVECDGVGRDKDDNIKLFIEITTGPIKSTHVKKLRERQAIAPRALIWFVGSRINDRVFDILNKNNAKITLIDQLYEKFPKLKRV